MGHLIYLTNSTLDGHTEDLEGNYDWTTLTDEFFSFITNHIRAVGTYLYGRRMYETMRVWETDPDLAARSALMLDFAEVWQSASKIVYSSTLEIVSTRKTQLERNFDPGAIRQLKEAVDQDILIGGSELAAHAFRAGLVDECQLMIHPIIIGAGKQALPDDVRVNLELLEERSFDNGVVFLRYRIRPGSDT